MKRFNIFSIFLIVAAILMLHSCAINPVTGNRQLMFMSEEEEIKLGSEYDPQVIATFGEYINEPLFSLIEEKGNEMGLISHRPKLTYHFRILDSPVINAFAVPGGYIYLTRGILAQFNNEAEMLGVLGHEMGHIAARHSVSQLSKQQVGQLLLVGGMIASEGFRKYGERAMQGMQLLFLSFSRENEREADQLGVEYTSKIKYDAHKMADFYQVLKKMNLASDHSGIPTFLSTHPDPGDRYNSVIKDATKWQDSLDFSSWKVNKDNYLHLIDGMVFGDDPRQGYVEGQIFYHPELEIKFPVPSGWALENSPNQVRISQPDGKALMLFTIAQQKTLDEAAKVTLQQLKLNLLESNKTTVNGMPAISALSNQTSQDQSTGQQLTIKVLSYFIDDNGTYYVFHGVSAEADFNNYSPVFEPTMVDFDKLTEPSKLNVQPKRIRIQKVEHTGTLKDAFQSFGIQEQQMEEFAFLNNMELSDQLPAGALIKIVRD
ncbi:M48 family metalloprotease [Bacteroidota bacterium]